MEEGIPPVARPNQRPIQLSLYSLLCEWTLVIRHKYSHDELNPASAYGIRSRRVSARSPSPSAAPAQVWLMPWAAWTFRIHRSWIASLPARPPPPPAGPPARTAPQRCVRVALICPGA